MAVVIADTAAWHAVASWAHDLSSDDAAVISFFLFLSENLTFFCENLENSVSDTKYYSTSHHFG